MGIRGSASVTIISARAGVTGTSVPSIADRTPVCGPAASTTRSQATSPAPVFTAVTLPPAISKPVTGVFCRMRPPRSRNAQA